QADFIVVSCITCLMYLDNIQKKLNEAEGTDKYHIPVFDYNQLLALCMGFDPKQVASICTVPRNSVIDRI
ncbi:MAG: heterodisulfide reductase, partial [Proteobacteria bacterium]|nr:heterodisulfide reductase [Pseudomonadota bacterium]